ncbi:MULTISPECIES: alpha/beta fold hydrolase [unclassified Frondihabitans]|uniref:alpha/beta fold hydrolase n=1 Tax=unclassified Frondihabitans TaxID=2626248 RepID=UPI000FA516B8|nr:MULTISPECIES: alpha/beta hydrolase [unclassified Frondihabitans]RPE77834.1 pimeloyl-ACP methyl ester carboxylesterase [Frondihabitans sp. PhB153]RPF08113.1 pimeloyl-ACP methyl ester carboxylesterase [Frondihabitans sp. PhB161]
MDRLQVPYRDVRTPTVAATGVQFAYREFGLGSGFPLVLLTHLGANLDSWDPQVVDGLARDRHVIALDYQGVGLSTGTARSSFAEMALDVVNVVQALGYDKIDLFGLSMGGMVAQAVIELEPKFVDRLILAGSGPAGGPGLASMTGVTLRTAILALATVNDPKTLLFFTRTPSGRRAAHDYLARLKRRSDQRDRAVTSAVYRAQLTAVAKWGQRDAPVAPLWRGPAMIVHGDSDRMVPPKNAALLSHLIPTASVTIYPDSGHGAVFQNADHFVTAARALLSR